MSSTHKATSLCHKFDENMKGDSKLLITEATFGFVCFSNVFVKPSGKAAIT